MTIHASTGVDPITRRHSCLLLAASVLTLLLISLGGIVCVTESGAACPDWPGCFGRAVPPLQVQPIIEYLHRFVAALTTPIILAAAITGWGRAGPGRWVTWPPVVATIPLVAVIIFGALAVLRGLPPAVAAVDLGSALTVAALLLTATGVAFARRSDPDLPDRLSLSTPLARLAWTSVAAVFLIHVTGILTAGKGSLTRCLGWPIWRLIAGDLPGWPQTARLGLALVAAAVVVATIGQAWRGRTEQAGFFRLAAMAGASLLIEMLLGLLLLAAGSSAILLILYVLAAAALWGLLVVLATRASLAAAAAGEADAPGAHRNRPAGTRLNQGEGL